MGPGQYDGFKQFGEEAKTFTLGEKREEKTAETMGPGSYNPERADGITRIKTTSINMGA